MIALKPPPERVHTYPDLVLGVPSSGGRLAPVGSPSHAQVLDRVDLAVIATDAVGVITTWNSRAETLYGWSRDEACGQHIIELMMPPASRRAAESVLATLQRGDPWQGPFRLRRKDASTVTAFVKNSPILGDDGAMIGVVGVSIEIGDPDLAEAVRAVAAVDRGAPSRRVRTLSPREREVLGLLARGLTGEQIAERLVLSPETIRTHIRNAREKLGASTRVEAVTMALIAREIQV
jgi:PAS domain S-box-containing protein